MWQGKPIESARRFLVLGDRAAIPVCSGCDALSYRVGLLPDAKGKVTLPLPTTEDQEIVNASSSGATMTHVVLRRWDQPV
jgi:hypothetical protein